MYYVGIQALQNIHILFTTRHYRSVRIKQFSKSKAQQL